MTKTEQQGMSDEGDIENAGAAPPSADRKEVSDISDATSDSNTYDVAGTLRDAGGAGVLAVLWMLLPVTLLVVLIVYFGDVGTYLREDLQRGVAVYLALFTFGAGLGLLPTHVQAFLGGWAFGFARGGPLAVAGATLASIIGFAVASTIGRRGIDRLIARDARAEAVREELVGKNFKSALSTVFLLRLSPSSPFALTNLALSTTGAGFFAYVVGTLTGMAPRTLLVAWMGAAVAGVSAEDVGSQAKGPGKWGVVIGVAILFGVFTLLSKRAERALDRLQAREHSTEPSS